MEFTETIATFKKMGCDFSGCEKDQDYLDKIEQFENKESQEGSNFVSTDERIAAALEAQLMLSIPDEEEGEEFMTFEIVKSNYDKGLWGIALVKLSVKKGIITKNQYKEITGKDYK